jgi:recombination protein RecT
MSKEIMKQEKSKAMEIAKKHNNFKDLKSSQITEVITGMSEAFKSAIAKTINSDRFVIMASTLFDRNPALKECTLPSIFGALQQSAILGFDISPTLGLCYFVPRNAKVKVNGVDQWVKEVTFQIGYKGYLELARRSDSISDIYAEVVFEGDEFEVEYGLNRKLTHNPKFQTDEHDKLLYAYAVAKFKDGTTTFAVLTKKQIEKRRMLSPNQVNYKGKTREASVMPLGVWESHYAEMAKGKAIRALATYLPLSTQDQQRLLLPESQVIRRNVDEPPVEFTSDEYRAEIEEYEEEYSVDQETGEIQEVDNMKSLIDEDAKK